MDQMFGGGSSATSPTGEGPPNPQQQQNQEEELQQQKQRQEEFKNQVLNQILDQQARARLSTLSLAKPDKAQAVESLLIQNARMGRIGAGGKITEAQLIDILEKVGGGGGPMGGGIGGGSSSVNFSRRVTTMDDDDDEEYNRIMEDL